MLVMDEQNNKIARFGEFRSVGIEQKALCSARFVLKRTFIPADALRGPSNAERPTFSVQKLGQRANVPRKVAIEWAMRASEPSLRAKRSFFVFDLH